MTSEGNIRANWPNRPLSVGLICDDGLGGSSRSAVRLANALVTQGHQAHIFSRRPVRWPVHALVTEHFLYQKRVQVDAIIDSQWPTQDSEQIVALIQDVTTSSGLHLLHAHYALPFGEFAFKAKHMSGTLDIPYVVTLHGTDLTRLTHLPSLASRYAKIFEQASVITCVSRHMQHKYQQLFSSRIPRVIPNFVEKSWGSSSTTRCSGAISAKFRLLHVSNYRPIKQSMQLCDIFELLQRKVDSELWLVGDGPDLPRLKDQLAAQGLLPSVRCLGIVQSIESLLNQVNVLVLTSQEESFGLSALEAMAAGVPVLAPRVGGLPELIADGENGMLYPRDDVPSAVKRLLLAIDTPGFLQDIGAQARVRAQYYQDEKIVPAFLAAYHESLSNAEKLY